MGQVLQGGAGQAPARQAAVGAGLPIETPADTINKVCASSIRAVEIADSMIRAGDAERRRHRRDGVDVERALRAREGAVRLSPRRRDADRPDDPRRPHLDASTASTWSSRRRSSSRELGISREEQDAWAYRSHQRAVARDRRGPLRRRDRPGRRARGRRGPRRDTSLEKLATLKPVFDPQGTTTAGNAPGVNDGASCVLVASEEWARGAGSSRSRRSSRRATSPTSSPTSRARRRRRRRSRSRGPGKTIGDVTRVEINEAFSSVASHSTRLLGADEEIVNVNGGAVALGHPIGASGGRILGDARPRAAPRTAAGSGSRRSARAAGRATRC